MLGLIVQSAKIMNTNHIWFLSQKLASRERSCPVNNCTVMEQGQKSLGRDSRIKRINWGLLAACMGFPGGSVVKSQSTSSGWVWSLGQKDPLEEEMASHSSILAWKIPWAATGGLQSVRSRRVGHD